MPIAVERGVVAVFAKAPQSGSAKTRLIATLGEQGAATLHARLVERTLATVRAACAADTELWCSPDEAHPFFVSLARRERCLLRRQSDGDLGIRMSDAFETMLRHTGRALIVGSDCPLLAVGDLELAMRRLAEGCDAVLGPAEDGGYYLIGLRRPEPRVFQGVAWGGEQVLEQTRARLRMLGLRWQEIAPHWDVDRPEDLERLRADPALRPLLAGLAADIDAA